MHLLWKFLLISFGIFFMSRHTLSSAQCQYLRICEGSWPYYTCQNTPVILTSADKYQVQVCKFYVYCGKIELSPENFEWTSEICKTRLCFLKVIPELVVGQGGCSEDYCNLKAPRGGVTTSMKPFFITSDLPYSIVMGETLFFNVTITNNFCSSTQDIVGAVTVIIESAEFKTRKEIRRGIYCPPNSVKSLDFWIKPVKPEDLIITIIADALDAHVIRATGDARSARVTGDALSTSLHVITGGVKTITRKIKTMEATGFEKEAYAVRSDHSPGSRVRGREDTHVSLSSVGKVDAGIKTSASVDIFGVNTLSTPPAILEVAKGVQVDVSALQNFKIAADYDVIYFHVGGVGTIRANVTWTQYLEKDMANSTQGAFSLEVKRAHNVIDTSDLELEICVRHLLQLKSNLTVMEVKLPSGYTLNPNGSYASNQGTFKGQEITEARGKVKFYFDQSQTTAPTCATVEAFKSFTIKGLQESYVHVFDYYEPNTKFAVTFYSARSDRLRERN